MPQNNSKVFAPKPVGDLVGQRREAVDAAWSTVDPRGVGTATLASLVAHYDAARHPLAASGQVAKTRLADQFREYFVAALVASGANAGETAVVPYEMFVQYHEQVSRDVHKMRVVSDFDAMFLKAVTGPFHLDGGRPTGAAVTEGLEPTGIIPRSSLDTPNAAAYDLVWRGDDGALYGAAGVVRGGFARSVLPVWLRGYLATATEAAIAGVRHVPLRAPSASGPPLDLIWHDGPTSEPPPADDATGKRRLRFLGLRGVVSGRIDTTAVPPQLSKHLSGAAHSGVLGVEYAPGIGQTDPAMGIAYRTTSADYGVRALEEAQQTNALKKKVFEGTSCGHVYAGITGKFSEKFPAGPYTFSGLNTSLSAHQRNGLFS